MAKLRDLWICVDCEEVFEMRKSRTRRCPGCAGSVSRPLSVWLKSMANLAILSAVRVPETGGNHGDCVSEIH
jgi:hypothetical protein